MKKILIYLLITLLSTSCYYKPFVKYRLNKKGFRTFSKKEFFAGDNANPYRNYEVKKYQLNLEIFPDKKSIDGDMTIHFVTTAKQKVFMFDFKNGFKIESISTSVGEAKIKYKNDLLFLTFNQDIAAKTRVEFYVKYKGKPKNIAGEGPIQWKKDDQERHWISSSTEGIGPHFMMPCNGLLRDEADTTEINITVPDDLIVSANGQLVSVESNKSNHTKKFKHLVTNPINVYNISFNIGHFVTLHKPYTDINGVDRKIECVVMDYNEKVASKFYDRAPIIMGVFEELYGVFPWWNDGCRFIESTFAAMEHQSGIAMGDEYEYDWEDDNMTLVHELSHEWWGNNVTAYDYCDAWIHEGLATYSEALFIEKVYGKDAYNEKIKKFYYGTMNKIPVKKVCGVKYSSWISYNDMDIYDKGALMMHSLRILVDDDELFLQAMHDFQQQLPHSNINSEHFIQEFNNLLGKDYSSLFHLYLNETKPPHLQFYSVVTSTKRTIYYKWDKALPFNLKEGVFIEKDDKRIAIHPTTNFQSFESNASKGIKFLLAESIYYLPKAVDPNK